MRTNFSPLAEAARRHAARAAAPAARATVSVSSVTPITPSSSPVPSWSATEERWCEWPRRVNSLPPFRGIRQALQQIQAIQTRHA
jgi:hypothetical protein